ncbi:MAG TPA: non-canonical purine NTP pyrophosphatase, partial [Polyangiaceae bacterium]|nr:non-canonical purine NTP pyrophosphatase [Polyangiaceae bacterium]
MEVVFATTNPHKLRELREQLEPVGVTVRGLDELGVEVPAPAEDATTFEGNARAKAVGYAQALGRACLADDSGLEVDALGGAPGVHSARYAGVTGIREERDQANNRKLFETLRAHEATHGRGNRAARLVCALCLATESGEVSFLARGTFEGQIVDEPRGARGFGYDGHLWLPELGKTAAELTAQEL